MKRRLKIYFIHSTKYDYNNLIYKPVLSSNICMAHDLWLPMSKTYQSKYAKDLITKADLIIAEVSNPSFGEKLELKWASMVTKPIIYLSFDNKIPKKVAKYVPSIETIDDNNSFIKIIENFISKYANITDDEQKDPTVILGQIN